MLTASDFGFSISDFGGRKSDFGLRLPEIRNLQSAIIPSILSIFTLSLAISSNPKISSKHMKKVIITALCAAFAFATIAQESLSSFNQISVSGSVKVTMQKG